MSVQKQATNPEIMAPAGSFASLHAAINAGADSIFFGVTQLNMRARAASNLSLEDMKEIASICKKAGVKAYVTMNALLYEHDLNLMRRILDEAKAAGIDAAIVQDMAAIQYATEIGMPIHASTQLSISNYETVKFYARFADTIVLARELDLKMIKNICDKIKEDDLRGPAGELIKIEVFVHGALCIAVSGRCHMSLLQTNTSAQRGACLQECRKSYRITDEETGKEMVVDNNYVLSPADLCTLPFLDEMVDSGISIFKIEGRGRSPDYVDTVVRTYREALEAIADGTFNQQKVQEWMSQLEKTFN
ncbi:U32 family peptidase, partial [Candidatus Peregrinibacteria bacterium]|nr:U32 family peptidase [Candidatus Peregrinibacteria bacterium]